MALWVSGEEDDSQMSFSYSWIASIINILNIHMLINGDAPLHLHLVFIASDSSGGHSNPAKIYGPIKLISIRFCTKFGNGTGGTWLLECCCHQGFINHLHFPTPLSTGRISFHPKLLPLDS